MPRRARGLNAALIEKTTRKCRLGDGAGLYVTIRGPESKFWIFRYLSANGKLREMGLGSATGAGRVSLAEARKTRDRLLAIVRAGGDPLKEKAAARAAEAKAITFKETAEQFIASHRAGWKSKKHAAQWPSTLAAYTYPHIGAMAVAAVNVSAVLKVLQPIWTTKPQTASRLRARLESILDYAKARGLREGENPARWRGGIDHLLPATRKVAPVRHHAALSYPELPAFMAELRALLGVAARLTEFTILTASRSGESLGARWTEIDMDARLWQIPGERMKSGRPHRVPLSDAAMAILAALPREGDHVFAGRAAEGRLASVTMLDVLSKRLKRRGITMHGFRSTFRDWAGNETNVAREVAEAALAHVAGDATETAYRRSDALEKRRALMEAWSRFACDGPALGNVTSIRARS